MVHGELWTLKEFFVLPNEYIYWSIQIVMYPYMTGLVAGAFVLSSLYHVFAVEQLKSIARFALVFSFALLPVAMLPLVLHLQQPLRGSHVLVTPHFTSAISAFGIVFLSYGCIVAMEIWFVYRQHIIQSIDRLSALPERTLEEQLLLRLYRLISLGARDLSPAALHADHKAVRFLAGLGIPVACFLHGYAGFIFGSVKANALWMTPLMPVIFICSAIVSGIALCILCYALFSTLRQELPRVTGELDAAARYLLIFMVLAITLELLDVIFRGYTAQKSWDILREVIYHKDFNKIFLLQYGLGNIVPFLLLLLPGRTPRRIVLACLLVLFGVFMMRWNVVIGGQAFSLTFAGFMEYQLPLIPTSLETLKEGLVGALLVAAAPFVLFFGLNRIFPAFAPRDSRH